MRETACSTTAWGCIVSEFLSFTCNYYHHYVRTNTLVSFCLSREQHLSARRLPVIIPRRKLSASMCDAPVPNSKLQLQVVQCLKKKSSPNCIRKITFYSRFQVLLLFYVKRQVYSDCILFVY